MSAPVQYSQSGHVKTLIQSDEKDRPVFHLEARALTPVRVKIADGLAACSTLGTCALIALGVDAALSGASIEPFVAALAALFTAPLQRKAARHVLRARREMEIAPEYFAFKTLSGWKHYPRNQVGGFSMPTHRRAKHEARQIEYKQRQAQLHGQVHKPSYVYIDSFELSFDLLQSRVKVMDVYGEDVAQDILGEIRSRRAIAEGARGFRRGKTLSPEDDHTGESGTLPLPGPVSRDRCALPGPEAGALPQIEHRMITELIEDEGDNTHE